MTHGLKQFVMRDGRISFTRIVLGFKLIEKVAQSKRQFNNNLIGIVMTSASKKWNHSSD